MDNERAKNFCLQLLKADTEEEVISLLKELEFWDNPSVWRLYGDKEGNFATAGSQQAQPEAALVEKIINSVDACLVNECLLRRINPESEDAPNSIRQAVARFYEDRDYDGQDGGVLREWTRKKIREIAGNITLAATGTKTSTCLTIVDCGEGQTPNRIPDTILSLNRRNKQRIRFVQGKFNMGGTGVLRHCGRHSFQLIISKRNPIIVEHDSDSDHSSSQWGFTLVRRERPSGKVGDVINSEFKYLAPVTGDKKCGVLRFHVDDLPLMPEYNDPYVTRIPWGTLIKLYNYDMSAGASHILRPDGLIYRLEVLLPEIALPVRLHECRKYFKGEKEKSFVTNLAGLAFRIEEGKGSNLEVAPWDVPFNVHGLIFLAKIYVFKKNKAKTYIKNEGVLFSINGQTHGHLPRSIFARKNVGLSRLGKDLLVTVDCTAISVDAREDLFMSSRDRLSKGELRYAIERQLEEILGTDEKLSALQDKRKDEEIAERLDEQRPLEQILDSIIKSSPTLSALFLSGRRLSMPKKHGKAATSNMGGGEGEGTQGGSEQGQEPFVGKKHPTYFRFQKAPNTDFYRKNCEQGRMVRVEFETDVENEYFTRTENPGRYELEVVSGNIELSKISHSLNLHDGVAQWSINLPHNLVVDEHIALRCIISDNVLLQPFVNVVELTVIPRGKEGKGGTPPCQYDVRHLP